MKLKGLKIEVIQYGIYDTGNIDSVNNMMRYPYFWEDFSDTLMIALMGDTIDVFTSGDIRYRAYYNWGIMARGMLYNLKPPRGLKK